SGLCSWHIAQKPKPPPQALSSFLTRPGGLCSPNRSLDTRKDHRSRVVALSRYRAAVFRNCPSPILRCCGPTRDEPPAVRAAARFPRPSQRRGKGSSFPPCHGPGASFPPASDRGG